MDMNNVKEKPFLPTHLLWGILGLLVIGIGLVSLFMPVLAQSQDVMETDSARNTQWAAILGLSPEAAASQTASVATRYANLENSIATSNAKPTTEAHARRAAQWDLTRTAVAPFLQATSAVYTLTAAVTSQAQTATWQARGPMWQMENDPLVKIADILQQDMVAQSGPILADTPIPPTEDWDNATPVLVDDTERRAPPIVRWVLDQSGDLVLQRYSEAEGMCFNTMGCTDGQHEINRHCERTYYEGDGSLTPWGQCIVNYLMNKLITPETISGFATKAAEETKQAESWATQAPATCSMNPLTCHMLTVEATARPRSTTPSQYMTKAQRRARSLDECYPGGQTLSDRIVEKEARREDTHQMKTDFEAIFGSPCQCYGICVH